MRNILVIFITCLSVMSCNSDVIEDDIVVDLIEHSDSLEDIFQSYNIDIRDYKKEMESGAIQFQEYWGEHFGEYSGHYKIP